MMGFWSAVIPELYKDEYEVTRPGDTTDAYVLGPLKARYGRVRVPVAWAFLCVRIRRFFIPPEPHLKWDLPWWPAKFNYNLLPVRQTPEGWVNRNGDLVYYNTREGRWSVEPVLDTRMAQAEREKA